MFELIIERNHSPVANDEGYELWGSFGGDVKEISFVKDYSVDKLVSTASFYVASEELLNIKLFLSENMLSFLPDFVKFLSKIVSTKF